MSNDNENEYDMTSMDLDGDVHEEGGSKSSSPDDKRCLKACEDSEDIPPLVKDRDRCCEALASQVGESEEEIKTKRCRSVCEDDDRSDSSKRCRIACEAYEYGEKSTKCYYDDYDETHPFSDDEEDEDDEDDEDDDEEDEDGSKSSTRYDYASSSNTDESSNWTDIDDDDDDDEDMASSQCCPSCSLDRYKPSRLTVEEDRFLKASLEERANTVWSWTHLKKPALLSHEPKERVSESRESIAIGTLVGSITHGIHSIAIGIDRVNNKKE